METEYVTKAQEGPDCIDVQRIESFSVKRVIIRRNLDKSATCTPSNRHRVYSCRYSVTEKSKEERNYNIYEHFERKEI